MIELFNLLVGAVGVPMLALASVAVGALTVLLVVLVVNRKRKELEEIGDDYDGVALEFSEWEDSEMNEPPVAGWDDDIVVPDKPTDEKLVTKLYGNTSDND